MAVSPRLRREFLDRGGFLWDRDRDRIRCQGLHPALGLTGEHRCRCLSVPYQTINCMADEDPLANVVDSVIMAWGESVERGEHPSLAGRSLHECRLLARAVAWWAGCGDPYRQGAGQCVHASFIIQRMLKASGVDCEPLTVRATVRSPEGRTAVIGSAKPRIRTSPISGVRFWTGHEVVHIPEWSLVVDPTLFQVARDISSTVILAPAVLPAGDLKPSALSLRDEFGGELSERGWSAEYAVTKANHSYRDDPHWRWQEAELMRAVEYGYGVWRRDGLLAP